MSTPERWAKAHVAGGETRSRWAKRYDLDLPEPPGGRLAPGAEAPRDATALPAGPRVVPFDEFRLRTLEEVSGVPAPDVPLPGPTRSAALPAPLPADATSVATRLPPTAPEPDRLSADTTPLVVRRAQAEEAEAARQRTEDYQRIPAPARLAFSTGKGVVDAATIGLADDAAAAVTEGLSIVVGRKLADPYERFEELERGTPERLAELGGFAGGAGSLIALQNRAAGALAPHVGSERLRRFLQNFGPGANLTRGQTVARNVAEGVPFDLAYDAESGSERALAAGLGAAGGAGLGLLGGRGVLRAADDAPAPPRTERAGAAALVEPPRFDEGGETAVARAAREAIGGGALGGLAGEEGRRAETALGTAAMAAGNGTLLRELMRRMGTEARALGARPSISNLVAPDGVPVAQAAFLDPTTGRAIPTGGFHDLEAIPELGLRQRIEEATRRNPQLEGFIDANGRFYSRAEVRERTGVLGESTEQAARNPEATELARRQREELGMEAPTDDLPLLPGSYLSAVEGGASRPKPPELDRPTAGLGAMAASALDERGAVDATVLRELGTTGVGAAAGAATGAAVGGEGNRTTGAITGALIGGRLGRVLSRRARSTPRAPQLADGDPDVQAVLTSSARPGVVRRIGDRLRGAAANVPQAVRSTYQALLDDVYAARRFGREVGGTEAVSVEASRSRGWRGWADELVGVRKPKLGNEPTHPTLRSAVEAARGREADVVALLHAERALELDRNGLPFKGVDLQAASAAAEKLNQVPEVREAAQKLRDFYRHLLDLRHQNGLIDDEAYATITASGEYYVPFLRDLGEEAGPGVTGGGGKLFRSSSGVRQMKDTEVLDLKILDPYEQAILDAQSTTREVSRQRVFNAIATIAEGNPAEAGNWIRRVPPKFLGTAEDGRVIVGTPRGKDGRIVTAMVDGKRQHYEVLDEDLYNSLSSIAPETNTIAQRLVQLFSLPAQGLRAGVTAMPAFGAANATRDAFFTVGTYQFPRVGAASGALAGGATGAAMDEDDRVRGFLTGAGLGTGLGTMAPHAARIAKGMRHVFGNDETYQAWLREGGSGTGFFIPDRRTAQQLLRQMQKEGAAVGDFIRPGSWWETLQFINRAIEEAPRVAKFSDELARGTDPAAAAVASRDVSLDFSRGGSETKEIRKLRAFWNPMLQGLDKLRGVLNPVKNPRGYAVGLAAMTAPSVALWSINKDDPEYWNRPLWERNLAWLVPMGQHEDGRTRFLKIPKPFEPGYVFASLPERALDYLHQRDPERAMEALREMLGSSFGDLVPVPTGVEPLMENAFNFDTFRQRPVVGYNLQDLPARDQYDAETSSLGIGLSRAAEMASLGLLEISPEKIDHVLEGYTGTLGKAVNEGITRVAQATGLDSRATPPRRTRSQWARFVSQPNDFGTDDVSAMFRRFEAGDGRRKQWERLLEAGELDRAESYYQQHEASIETSLELAGYVKDFRKLAKERRDIERSDRYTAAEKEALIQDLGVVASELAAAAVGRDVTAPFEVPGGKEPAYAEPVGAGAPAAGGRWGKRYD